MISRLQEQLAEIEGRLKDPTTIHGQLHELMEKHEIALQTIGEQQDRIFLLESDLRDLRLLYYKQIDELKNL